MSSVWTKSCCQEPASPGKPVAWMPRLEWSSDWNRHMHYLIYTHTARAIIVIIAFVLYQPYLLLSKLRKRSCLSPANAFGEILWMRFSERSRTLRAIRGLKVLGGSIVRALRGRSSSDKFLIPVNMSALRMLIWFCPNMRKRRFSRSYEVKHAVRCMGAMRCLSIRLTLNPLDGRFVMWLP